MNPLIDENSDLLPDGLDQELLQDLERQNLDHIRKLRKHHRFEIAAKLRLRSGNSSSHEPDNVGETIDISSGGCAANFPKPVGVGDVYRLTVEDDRLDVPMVYARCLRCRLVREDVFEAGFTFFTSISLDSGESDGGDLLD